MKTTIGKGELRSFGFVIAGGFTAIALAPIVFRHHPARIWALAVAVATLLSALITPSLLRPVHSAWMALGEFLAWLNTRIILTIVYFLLVVPMGLIQRIAGKDPMMRQFVPESNTYRVPLTKRYASHMQRQY